MSNLSRAFCLLLKANSMGELLIYGAFPIKTLNFIDYMYSTGNKQVCRH